MNEDDGTQPRPKRFPSFLDEIQRNLERNTTLENQEDKSERGTPKKKIITETGPKDRNMPRTEETKQRLALFDDEEERPNKRKQKGLLTTTPSKSRHRSEMRLTTPNPKPPQKQQKTSTTPKLLENIKEISGEFKSIGLDFVNQDDPFVWNVPSTQEIHDYTNPILSGTKNDPLMKKQIENIIEVVKNRSMEEEEAQVSKISFLHLLQESTGTTQNIDNENRNRDIIDITAVAGGDVMADDSRQTNMTGNPRNNSSTGTGTVSSNVGRDGGNNDNRDDDNRASFGTRRRDGDDGNGDDPSVLGLGGRNEQLIHGDDFDLYQNSKYWTNYCKRKKTPRTLNDWKKIHAGLSKLDFHCRFQNLASILIRVILQAPGGEDLLNHWQRKMDYLDVAHYIHYFRENPDHSFEISKISSEYWNKLFFEKGKPATLYSLDRLNICKYVVSHILLRLVKGFLKRITFNKRICFNPSYKQYSYQQNQQQNFRRKEIRWHMGRRSSLTTQQQGPLTEMQNQEREQFFQEHLVFKEQDGFYQSTANTKGFNGINDEFLAHGLCIGFDLLSELAEKDGYFFNQQEARSLGFLDIGETHIKEYNFATKKDRKILPSQYKGIQEHWKNDFASPTQTFWMENSNVQIHFYKKLVPIQRPLSTTQSTKVYSTHCPLNSQFKHNDDVIVTVIDEISTVIETANDAKTSLFDLKTDFSERMTKDSEFGWELIQNYFFNDYTFLPTQQILFDNVVLDDCWSINYSWSCLIGEKFTMTLYAFTQYLKAMGDAAMSQETQKLKEAIERGDQVAKEFLTQVIPEVKRRLFQND